jgi:ribose 5-phosphate isomerase A
MTRTVDDAKRAAGYAAVDRFVHADTACIGLGTGSTAYWAIERVGERVSGGWQLVAVATSVETERLCKARGIHVVGLCEGPPIEVAIDGADEVASDLSLIKGHGGALFREKAVAMEAKQFVVVVDDSKLVQKLGKTSLPIEVVPFTTRCVIRELEEICPSVQLRMRDGGPFLTDNGNHILDCSFGEIADPRKLDAALISIHGIVATGLFAGLTSQVLVGSVGGVRELSKA